MHFKSVLSGYVLYMITLKCIKAVNHPDLAAIIRITRPYDFNVHTRLYPEWFNQQDLESLKCRAVSTMIRRHTGYKANRV